MLHMMRLRIILLGFPIEFVLSLDHLINSQGSKEKKVISKESNGKILDLMR